MLSKLYETAISYKVIASSSIIKSPLRLSEFVTEENINLVRNNLIMILLTNIEGRRTLGDLIIM